MSCLSQTSQAGPCDEFSTFVCSVATIAAPAGTTTQRAERRLTINPKYGDGPRELTVRYLWCGTIGAPTVIVQGGISADRDVTSLDGSGGAGWWQSLVGEGRAIDLSRFRVLAIDWVSPQELGADSVSSEDQADVLAALLHALNIAQVHAFVGSSYGAMVALAFSARHASRVSRLLLLAGAHRPHPLATAQRSVQRGIVRLGQASGHVDEAMGLARQLAMTTYRGIGDFGRRFGGSPELREDRFHFPVEDYLENAGRRFVERFDADRFLGLSESIDLHDIDPALVSTPTTLIGFPSDRLVPLADLCELQQRLQGVATLEVIDSPYGHDAFLKEPEQLAPLFREALR